MTEYTANFMLEKTASKLEKLAPTKAEAARAAARKQAAKCWLARLLGL